MAKADLMGLVIVDIQKDAVAEETQKELQSMGVDVKFVTGDASSEDVIKEAVKVCVDSWGKIDILANIAGVSYMREMCIRDRLNIEKIFDTSADISDTSARIASSSLERTCSCWRNNS